MLIVKVGEWSTVQNCNACTSTPKTEFDNRYLVPVEDEEVDIDTRFTYQVSIESDYVRTSRVAMNRLRAEPGFDDFDSDEDE